VTGAQSRRQVAALLDRHGLRPDTSLGQHFLVDPNITRRIVDLVGPPPHRVLEIGVGTATLSAELLAAGHDLLGYEVDTRLRPLIEEVLGADPRAEIRFEDVMRVDLPGVLGKDQWVMASNLPYEVGTTLVLDALREVPALERFVVMVQREVAERMVAGPGDPAYGLPSVVVSLHATARIAFRVPPQVFLPPPRVGSAVVVLDRSAVPAGADTALRLAAAGFGQRRKMLRQSLASVLEAPSGELAAAGIDPRARAEEVAPDEWLRLAEVTGG
jgi:16S rRNA (adenine1518-N6/adenine1519-N6)-dimethyltransferase